MNKEPVILDKIHLLMEETGCDQGEAELAITSAGYDLERAIRTIGILLRNIVVVKGKFHLPKQNLYGLIILISDTKRQTLFRIRAVVSYNPALFETLLTEDWYEFEKRLYAFRLWEGTLQKVTQGLERMLWEGMGKGGGAHFFTDLRERNEARIQESFQRIISNYFSDNDIQLDMISEELNLQQFKHLKPKEEVMSPLVGPNPNHAAGLISSDVGENLLLDIELQTHPKGVPAGHIKAGDSVYVLLTDGRDIAQYLSKLLGGHGENGVKPLLAPVEDIRREGETIHLQVRLSVGILGLAAVSPDSLLQIQKRVPIRWWSRWFSLP